MFQNTQNYNNGQVYHNGQGYNQGQMQIDQATMQRAVLHQQHLMRNAAFSIDSSGELSPRVPRNRLYIPGDTRFENTYALINNIPKYMEFYGRKANEIMANAGNYNMEYAKHYQGFCIDTVSYVEQVLNDINLMLQTVQTYRPWSQQELTNLMYANDFVSKIYNGLKQAFININTRISQLTQAQRESSVYRGNNNGVYQRVDNYGNIYYVDTYGRPIGNQPAQQPMQQGYNTGYNTGYPQGYGTPQQPYPNMHQGYPQTQGYPMGQRYAGFNSTQGPYQEFGRPIVQQQPQTKTLEDRRYGNSKQDMDFLLAFARPGNKLQDANVTKNENKVNPGVESKEGPKPSSDPKFSFADYFGKNIVKEEVSKPEVKEDTVKAMSSDPMGEALFRATGSYKPEYAKMSREAKLTFLEQARQEAQMVEKYIPEINRKKKTEDNIDIGLKGLEELIGSDVLNELKEENELEKRAIELKEKQLEKFNGISFEEYETLLRKVNLLEAAFRRLEEKIKGVNLIRQEELDELKEQISTLEEEKSTMKEGMERYSNILVDREKEITKIIKETEYMEPTTKLDSSRNGFIIANEAIETRHTATGNVILQTKNGVTSEEPEIEFEVAEITPTENEESNRKYTITNFHNEMLSVITSESDMDNYLIVGKDLVQHTKEVRVAHNVQESDEDTIKLICVENKNTYLEAKEALSKAETLVDIAHAIQIFNQNDNTKSVGDYYSTVAKDMINSYFRFTVEELFSNYITDEFNLEEATSLEDRFKDTSSEIKDECLGSNASKLMFRDFVTSLAKTLSSIELIDIVQASIPSLEGVCAIDVIFKRVIKVFGAKYNETLDGITDGYKYSGVVTKESNPYLFKLAQTSSEYLDTDETDFFLLLSDGKTDSIIFNVTKRFETLGQDQAIDKGYHFRQFRSI